jgi:hypothetical protein
MSLCCYCGKEAKFKFKNGKFCCEDSRNKCSAMREKNRIGNLGRTHTKEEKDKISKALKGSFRSSGIQIDNEFVLCDFGCGQIAKFKLKNGKFCCSKRWFSCPIERQKNKQRRLKERQCPEFIQKLRKSISDSWKVPGRLEKNQIGLKNYYDNETLEQKELRIKMTQESHRTEKSRSNQSKVATEFWKRDGYIKN